MGGGVSPTCTYKQGTLVAHDRLPTGRMEGVWVEDGKQKTISGGWGANWGWYRTYGYSSMPSTMDGF